MIRHFVRNVLGLMLLCLLSGAAIAPNSMTPGLYVTSRPSDFAAVDVFIDTGNASLAAYQVHITAVSGDVRIVGIEGGAHDAFADPPYYDPAAIQRDEVILADYTLGADPPHGRTCLATIHIQIRGDAPPQFAAHLTIAANQQGRSIQPTVTCEMRTAP
jgi:hypothetical protein